MAVNGIRENDVSRSRSSVAAVTGALRRDPAIILSRSLVLFAAIGGDHLRRDQQIMQLGYVALLGALALC